MASTQVSITDEQVAEAPAEAKPAAEQARRGLWGAFRWRAHIVLANYMGLQAQVGLFGTDEFGDP